jgi:hypothetical protein
VPQTLQLEKAMKTERRDIGDRTIEITFFDVPMFHEDWHTAETLGLVYSHYNHEGPDYWDDSMVFCKPEDLDAYTKYNAENTW